MGELFKPGFPLRGDHIGIQHPLRRAEEILKRREKKVWPREIRLVCTICGKSFDDPFTALMHQEEEGHTCFRLEILHPRLDPLSPVEFSRSSSRG